MTKFEVVRYEYLPDRAIGQVRFDQGFFCYSLEDRVRVPGVKVVGETAIPEGEYSITVRPFRGDKTKQYVHIEGVPGFTGIAMHGGNGPNDSLGCILVAFQRDGDTIYGSAASALAKKVTSLNIKKITVRNGG